MKKSTPALPPWCPFCGQNVGRPSFSARRKMNEFPKGECQCGAVFACDATGHNVGAALVEALVSACNDNWDFAWELLPEDDYLTGRIENYDEMTHQVVESRAVDGRAVRGVLYFVRLHTEMAVLAERISKGQLPDTALGRITDEKSPAVSPDVSRPRQRATKELVRQLAEEGNSTALARLCLDDKKALRLLQRLLYDADEDRRWHTSWLISTVCARLADRDPGQVSELLHRLFEACSDSAATPWGMVETIGGVVAARPDIFGAFARHLLNFMGQQSTQRQVIWALAEIAASRPDLIRSTPFYSMFHYLQHPDPAIRGLMARLLGRIKASEATMQIMVLSDDHSDFVCWEKGVRCHRTVSAEVISAIAAIQQL